MVTEYIMQLITVHMWRILIRRMSWISSVLLSYAMLVEKIFGEIPDIVVVLEVAPIWLMALVMLVISVQEYIIQGNLMKTMTEQVMNATIAWVSIMLIRAMWILTVLGMNAMMLLIRMVMTGQTLWIIVLSITIPVRMIQTVMDLETAVMWTSQS